MRTTGPGLGADHPVGVGTGLAVSSVASVQFGAASAATLIPLLGALGTVSLRLAAAGLVLILLTRPWRRHWTRRELAASLLFAAVFVGMNSSLYLAIERLPLATVVTLEFLGPLGVAIATATRWRTRIWALPAAGGVLLLGGTIAGGDLLGVAFALLAAACWAAYILVNGRLGRTGSGLAGLGLATGFAALLMLPVGLLTAGPALWHPHVFGLGLLVGVLSSAIPYSLDLLALRRLPTAVFGVLTSLNPAVAALAGLLVLGQTLGLRQLGGITLVMLASAGVTLGSGRRRGRGRTAAPTVDPGASAPAAPRTTAAA